MSTLSPKVNLDIVGRPGEVSVQPAPDPQSGLNTLVVEDDPAALRLLESLLQKRGHRVTACQRAEEAWQLFQQERFPMVLLDLILPGMSGLELCRRIRALPTSGDSHILVITVMDRMEDLQAVLDAGGDDYLAKPVEVDLLNIRLTIAERQLHARKRQRAVEAEKEQLKAQFQHAQKLESLGIMAGGIAHEFNNLLMGVLGNASLALAEAQQSERTAKYLTEIEQTALRAAELTHQLLAYSGKGKRIVQPVSLTTVVKDIKQLVEAAVSRKAVLQFELESHLPEIEADPGQLRQIIMNLVTNASDALDGKSGVIRVSTGVIEAEANDLVSVYVEDAPEPGEYVVLEVSDTGRGMSEDTLTKIFDPFYTTKSLGRGLGLAAILGIVRGHNGTILVDSSGMEGTLFRILLPVAKGTGDCCEDHTDDWRGEGLVLVVDDEDTVRSVARMTLEKFGFAVRTACDGQEAVEMFEADPHEYSVVLLDLTMPTMDGETTFHALRKVRDDVPVIITSGYLEEEVEERFEGQDLTGILPKPYLPGALLDNVYKILGR